MTTSIWFTNFSRSTSSGPHLLCLASAGAYASEFMSWPAKTAGRVDVQAVLLPGRERRIREPCLTAMPELVDGIAQALPWKDEPIALFGHSFGALAMFELARHLQRTEIARVVHLFVSAQPAPTLPQHYPPPTASDEAIIEYIRALGGAPEDVLANPAFMRAYFPGMRADLSVHQKCGYDPQPPLLDCPITAYSGTDDTIATSAKMNPWQNQTTGPFRLVEVPGGHFFLRTSLPTLLDDIMHCLISGSDQSW
jgi:medium-chain acyl-[acyl-carrier-protein] hydrolase